MPARVEPLTPEQVLALPAMPPVKAAFAALNVSEGTGYKLIRDGDFPVEVIEFGRAKRVRKTELIAFLGLHQTAAAEVQSAAANTNDGAPGVQPEAPSEQSAPTSTSK
ncbi:helix-turn-helix domain-containing protein [Streptomyces olivaceoviridis]|uniref:helix-turn-helix domain-containing protein n=1 Tax=Streptomyces olivaceoviridis TaxID=1921 RepID=UPI0037021861